jgi:hypothetical protein
MTAMRVFDEVPRKRKEFKEVKARTKIEIARVLDDLGQTCQMETLYENHPQEFLYDVVWLNGSGTMELAVECEVSFSASDVLYDFRKLLHAKAPLKLMLFSDSSQLQRENIVGRIEEELKSFRGHVPGEEYIVVQFCNFQTGCMDAYRYRATRSVDLEKFFTHAWRASDSVISKA